MHSTSSINQNYINSFSFFDPLLPFLEDPPFDRFADLTQNLKPKKTGFYNKLDKIYIGALGDYEKLFNHPSYNDNNKIEICYFSKDIAEMEFPTLTLIKDFCDSLEKNNEILYIHTKGVRNPNSQYIEDWRKYMEYFLIEKHRNFD